MFKAGRAKWIFATLALCLLLSGLTPASARADTANEVAGWPLHLLTDTLPDQMTAFSGDSMSLINCGNSTQAKSFQYIRNSVKASSLPTATNGNGVVCNSTIDLAVPDGTFYTTSSDVSTGHTVLKFAAFKNGVASWQTDLSSDPHCSQANQYGAEANNVKMTYPTIGPDGNIYGVIQSTVTDCATYLAGINSVTGAMLFKTYLANGTNLRATKLWTYSDRIIVVDTNGTQRQFSYTGQEDTAKQFQFPVSSGPIGTLIATLTGRVFAIGFCVGWSQNAVVVYHDSDGTTGTINTSLSCNSSYFVPAANNNVAGYDYYGQVQVIHVDTLSASTVNVAWPTGYSNGMVFNYWQDENGNAIMVRNLYGAYRSNVGMTVDKIDGTTGAITNLFLMGVDSDHAAPYVRVSDITDGFLYSVICHNVSNCPNTASTNLDGWLHKITLTGFGAALKDTTSFTPYKSRYVALGDSYSSGEGTFDYDPSSKGCHRSSKSYVNDVATQKNLGIPRFAACSGAQTDDMFNPNPANTDEPSQLSNLDHDTSTVTLTLGGNDVDFAGIMFSCAQHIKHNGFNCSTDTTLTTNLNSRLGALAGNVATTVNGRQVHSLLSVYEAIHVASPSAKIYVGGYPTLFGNSQTNFLVNNDAPGGYDCATPVGVAYSYTDSQWLNAQASNLNNVIATAVSDAQNMGIDITYVPASLFSSHGLCDTSTPFFNGVVLPNPEPVPVLTPEKESMHPTVQGYLEGYAFAFETLMS